MSRSNVSSAPTSSTGGVDRVSGLGLSKFASDVKTIDISNKNINMFFRRRDLHPETLGSWSAKRLAELRKKREQKLSRTPMGEYVPSPTQQVLTTAAMPTPSAFDYKPSYKLIFHSVPKLTIGRKLHKRRIETTPGPQEYTIDRELYNSKNAPKIKSRKGFTLLPKVSEEQKATAATYALPSTIGKDSAKAVITSRPPQNLNVGMLPSYSYPPPGSLNTAGFYGSPKRKSKGVTFGQIPQPLSKDEIPGPIYNVPPKFPEGLVFELKGPSPWPPKIQGYDAPAPNTYLPKSTLGTGGKYPRITKRLPSVIQGKKAGPSPNTYTVSMETSRLQITMGSIPLPSRFPRQPTPAPNTYTIVKPPVKIKRKKVVKVVAKRSTMLPLRHAAVEAKRPPSLDLTYFKMEKFGRGTFAATIRSRTRDKIDNKLAPNFYCPCSDPGKPRIPAFTFGRKTITDKPPVTLNVPALPLPSTLQKKNLFTFGAPFKDIVPETVPSPTKYSLPSKLLCMPGKPCPGATLKGRPSPFVHHGIAKLRIATTATKLRIFSKKKPKRVPSTETAATA